LLGNAETVMGLGSRILGTAVLVAGGTLLVAAVIVAPKALRAARPLARDALRRGMRIYERTRTAAAEFVEDVEDLVAEVQSELSHEGATEPPVQKQANER
jgi:hypothetical protein